jgi:hypothetical protein
MVLGLQLQPPVTVEKLMDGQPAQVSRADANLSRKLRQLRAPLWRQPNFKSLTHARNATATVRHRNAPRSKQRAAASRAVCSHIPAN